MTCTRCQGLMVTDSFIDLNETGHLWMSGWRCMNCGHVADPVAEDNRRMQAAARAAVVSQPEMVSAASDMPLQRVA